MRASLRLSSRQTPKKPKLAVTDSGKGGTRRPDFRSLSAAAAAN